MQLAPLVTVDGQSEQTPEISTSWASTSIITIRNGLSP